MEEQNGRRRKGGGNNASSPVTPNVHSVQCVLVLGQWPGPMVWLGQGERQCGDVVLGAS